jgi:hypothetical protein
MSYFPYNEIETYSFPLKVDPVCQKCYINIGGTLMPVKNPRINVVLEKPLYHTIEQLANRDGVSLSLKVRELVKEALEIEDDKALSAFAEKRERTFTKTKALKHHEVW